MKPCVFCKNEHAVIYEGSYWRIIENKYPVTNGHKLLIPKRHIRTMEQLNSGEQKEFFIMWKKAQETESYAFIHPKNLQTVYHLHIHFIPSKKLKRGFLHTMLKEYYVK